MGRLSDPAQGAGELQDCPCQPDGVVRHETGARAASPGAVGGGRNFAFGPTAAAGRCVDWADRDAVDAGDTDYFPAADRVPVVRGGEVVAGRTAKLTVEETARRAGRVPGCWVVSAVAVIGCSLCQSVACTADGARGAAPPAEVRALDAVAAEGTD